MCSNVRSCGCVLLVCPPSALLSQSWSWMCFLCYLCKTPLFRQAFPSAVFLLPTIFHLLLSSTFCHCLLFSLLHFYSPVPSSSLLFSPLPSSHFPKTVVFVHGIWTFTTTPHPNKIIKSSVHLLYHSFYGCYLQSWRLVLDLTSMIYSTPLPHPPRFFISVFSESKSGDAGWLFPVSVHPLKLMWFQ